MKEDKKITIEVLINGKVAAVSEFSRSPRGFEWDEYDFKIHAANFSGGDFEENLKRLYYDLRGYFDPPEPEICDYDEEQEVQEDYSCFVNWDYESVPRDKWGPAEFSAYNLEDRG